MKKTLGILMAGVLAASAAMTSFAAPLGEYDPNDVMEQLQSGDEVAEDVSGQALNGVTCLTEMLAFAGAINADDDQKAALSSYVEANDNTLADDSLDTSQKLGLCACNMLLTLDVIAREADPNSAHADEIQNLMETFHTADDATTTGDEQYANALRFSAYMAATAATVCAPTEDLARQLSDGVEDFNKEFDAAQGDEQLQVSSKWLYKMIGALVKLQNSNNAEAIDSFTEHAEAEVESAQGPKQASITWLYNAVRAASGLAGNISAD